MFQGPSHGAATAEQHFALPLCQSRGTGAVLVMAVAPRNEGSVCRLTVLQGSLGDTNVPAQVLHQADRFGLAGCSNSVVVCSAVGCYKFLVDLANIVWFTQPKHNQVRITLA